MPILTYFGKSTRKEKRYMMRLENPKQTIHFGLDTGSTYVDHGDKKKRTAYLARHKKNEDWTEINAGSASALILWGDSENIVDNIKDYIKRFNLEVPEGTTIFVEKKEI